jgi:uncharacterized damage-inducible protein DinB
MPISLALDELFEYTDWERRKWHDWLQVQGDQVLVIGAGPHGDGRFASVGDLVKHIFSAEKRYVERLYGQPLTDPTSIPCDSIEALFQFGEKSRNALREFVGAWPSEQWNTSIDLKILTYSISATPRKIVTHVLMHEIRHWAQIGTLLRLQGLVGDFHDFLFSPAMALGKREVAS